MITGFNPSDMYAADHIERVLQMYPGVFSGIGEFSIHKEFVSSKVAGEGATFFNPALDRILDFAGEAGSRSSSTTTSTRPSEGQARCRSITADAATSSHAIPKTTIIWAHTGLGRCRPARADRR